MTARKLVAGRVLRELIDGREFGYQVFERDSGMQVDHELVIHTRIYDGVRVASSWATPGTSLPYSDTDEAIVYGRERFVGYVAAVTGRRPRGDT